MGDLFRADDLAATMPAAPDPGLAEGYLTDPDIGAGTAGSKLHAYYIEYLRACLHAGITALGGTPDIDDPDALADAIDDLDWEDRITTLEGYGSGAQGLISHATDTGVVSTTHKRTVVGASSSRSSAEGANVSGGSSNTASGTNSQIAGGTNNTASATAAQVSGGTNNTASGVSSHCGGGATNTASGTRSTVVGGNGNTATHDDSGVFGGYDNSAENTYATVVGGESNTASGSWSQVSGGWNNTASGLDSQVSGGSNNTASGDDSQVSGGTNNTASGDDSQVSGGTNNTASGDDSQVSGGSNNAASGYRSMVAASLNCENATQHCLALGYDAGAAITPNGTDQNLTIKLAANGGNGTCDGSWTGGGADYAEFFENADPGEIGACLLVARKGRHVRPANAGDRILGVVSPNPGIVGNAAGLQWQGRKVRDELGRVLTREVECVRFGHKEPPPPPAPPEAKGVVAKIVKAAKKAAGKDAPLPPRPPRKPRYDGAVEHCPHPIPTDAERYTITTYQEVEGYERGRKYIPRSERPAEWTCVGLMGQLRVRVDATVTDATEFVAPVKDGIGGHSNSPTNCEVMELLTPFDADRGYGVALCFVR